MRKSIKKIWAVALAATMTVGLAACGNDSQGESSKAEQQESMASSGESMENGDAGNAGETQDREPITITVARLSGQLSG